MHGSPPLRSIAVGGAPGAWATLGFDVDGSACRAGGVVLDLGTEGGGWCLEGAGGPASLDGIPTRWVPGPGEEDAAGEHPNGVRSLDHVVVVTDGLERSTEALATVGAGVRRTASRDGRRQAFLWLGDVICEVVEGPGGPGARIWGLTFVVGDLGAAAARLGPALGTARDAVQPGRRIAAVRREAGLGIAVALMTPHVRA